ncbi:MAG: DUF4398 domain-containing protein [Gammaproteobacteria bacterium]|nr:MAG: DUF4398 domain-containing protein [Gammaproteobacteria bacterium]
MAHLLRLSLTVLLGCLLMACAGKPTQEMSDARQMLQAATEAGAARFAPAYLARARRALEEAQEALELHAYGRARAKAEEAKRWASRAQAQAAVFRKTEAAVRKAAQEGRLTPEVEALWQKAMQAAEEGREEASSLARRIFEALQ